MTKPKTARLFPVPGRKPLDRLLGAVDQKRRNRFEFSFLPPELRAMLSNCLVTSDRKAVFVKNPKAACTTVAKLIYRSEHGHAYQGDIHQWHAERRNLIATWKSLLDLLETGYSFSVVRHPEARAISGFFDFFVNCTNPEAGKHVAHATPFGLYDQEDLSVRFDAFLDYLEASFASSVLGTDHHFRPQYVNLGSGKITLSYIARVETLGRDLAIIGEQTGLQLEKGAKTRVEKTNASGSEALQISARQRSRVEALFSDDYEKFGY